MAFRRSWRPRGDESEYDAYAPAIDLDPVIGMSGGEYVCSENSSHKFPPSAVPASPDATPKCPFGDNGDLKYKLRRSN